MKFKLPEMEITDEEHENLHALAEWLDAIGLDSYYRIVKKIKRSAAPMKPYDR